MSCVNDTVTLIPNGFYPSASCAGPTPYCPPGISKHYKCGRTCGGSDWQVDPPLYYSSKSAALEDGACYLAENGVCAPNTVRIPGARTVERPPPSCAEVRREKKEQWRQQHPCLAEKVAQQDQQNSDLQYPTVPQSFIPNIRREEKNNDASIESYKSNNTNNNSATPNTQIMGDTRPNVVATRKTTTTTDASLSLDGRNLGISRQELLRRGQERLGGDAIFNRQQQYQQQPYGGVYPYLPPAQTQRPCPTTAAPGPPMGRPKEPLPCGNQYIHDGFRASCGAYNYGAGNACGECGCGSGFGPCGTGKCGTGNCGCGIGRGATSQCGYANRWGEASYGCEVAKTGCGGTCPPNEFTYDGWTEVGTVMNTDAFPITDYLTKSCTRCDADPFLRCQFGECTGCRAQANPLDRGDDGQGGNGEDYLPEPSSMNLENNYHHQRRSSAFERPTMWTNAGIGYGPFGSPIGGPRCGTRKNSSAGWNYGTLHNTGCKCNRCNSDFFYHPKTSITTPTVSRKYRLFARRAIDCNSAELSSSRLEFAVAPAGVVDPMLIVLPRDARQPPGCCYYASNCGVDYNERAWVELKSGDRIYIPGELGSYEVHLYADDAGPYRQNHGVFRGWGPVRRLPGRVRQHYSNSGLRNFSGTPSAQGLLRPW